MRAPPCNISSGGQHPVEAKVQIKRCVGMLRIAASLGVLLVSAAVIFCNSAQAQQHANVRQVGVRFGSTHFVGARFMGRRIGSMGYKHYDHYRNHDRRRRRRYGRSRYVFAPIVGGLSAAPYFAPEPYYYSSDYYASPINGAIVFCMRRFKNYDFWSHTYLGIDGYRHPCP